MIFVTVGYHTPFSRLLDAMDALAPQTGHTVVMQAGTYRFKPKHSTCFDFTPDMEKYLDGADLVVTQGGYTVLELIRRRKQFIVFPRLARYGEVINDHQLEFSLKLRNQLELDFPVLEDAGQLLPTIAGFRPIAYGKLKESFAELQGYLKGYLESVRRGTPQSRAN